MRYLIILCLFAVAGCRYNRDIAQKQFGRAAATYSDIADRYCIDKFPVKTVTDSTEYKKSKHVIDSLANVIKEDSLLSVIDRSNLEKEIAIVRERLAIPKNCDSLIEPLYRALAKEIQYSNRLQAANNELIKAAQNIKPVHDTVESIALQAKYAVADKERGDAIGLAKERGQELAAMTILKDEWKAKAKKRFWIILGIGAAMALGLFVAIRKKILRK